MVFMSQVDIRPRSQRRPHLPITALTNQRPPLSLYVGPGYVRHLYPKPILSVASETSITAGEPPWWHNHWSSPLWDYFRNCFQITTFWDFLRRWR